MPAQRREHVRTDKEKELFPMQGYRPGTDPQRPRHDLSLTLDLWPLLVKAAVLRSPVGATL